MGGGKGLEAAGSSGRVSMGLRARPESGRSVARGKGSCGKKERAGPMRIGTRGGRREREREARGRGEGAARAAPWLCRFTDVSQRIKLALGRTRNSHDWDVIGTAPRGGRRVGGVVVRRARERRMGETSAGGRSALGRRAFELGRTHAAFSPSTLLLASNFWQAAQGRLLLTAGGARPIRQHSARSPKIHWS